jgi:hypothetical protein
LITSSMIYSSLKTLVFWWLFNWYVVPFFHIIYVPFWIVFIILQLISLL